MTYSDQLTEEQLETARELAGWRTRQDDAESVNNTIETDIRIQTMIDTLDAELEADGINPDHVVVWSDERDCWTVA